MWKKHKKCKIPLIYIAIFQVYDCIYKRGKNEVFRTSDFVLVLCFVVLIIKLTSFCNFCFIILVEVIVVKSANGFFMFGVLLKSLQWTCTFFSILHQHCISPRSISALGPSSLWHILVSRADIWWNMNKGYVFIYSLWERQCILFNGEGNTKDTIHFSFLKNMIWIFMLLPNLG